MFGFKRKKKATGEIKRLLSLLEEDPEDVENRLMLASLYLEGGDQEKAIKEYRTAAGRLRARGSDLEAIAIYKKIFTLDGISLTEESSASVRQADELLEKVRETYEEALQGDRQEDEAEGTPESPGLDSHERRDDLEEERISIEEAPDLASFEVVSSGGQDQEESNIDSSGTPREQLQDRDESSRGGLRVGDVEEFLPDRGDQETVDFPAEAVQDEDVLSPVDEARITRTADFLDSTGDPKIDLKGVQMDDDLETMLYDSEAGIPTDDPLAQNTPKSAGNRDVSAILASFQKNETGDNSSRTGATESITEPSDNEDPDLPYNLGIAYYEMDLIDKAIKEFAKAHNQGIKRVESLYMLAKCYVKKGLFHNAAGFIVQALKLDDLTQVQIDMLQRQLEEIRDRMNLADPSRSKQPDP